DDSGGAYDSGTGVWNIGALSVSGTATLNITATVDVGTAGSTITNMVEITALAETDPNPGNNTASVDIMVQKRADLGVTKTVDNLTPNEGDTIVYTITVTNAGPHDATGVQVTDSLPSGVTYVSDDSSGAYDPPPGTGVWSVGTVPVSGSVTLNITATVDVGTAGSTITNTVDVTALAETDPNPGNDSASVDITVP
ncbi:MAG: DUF11 domain-containing protein, partial [Chloroflexi bacterium]|nr:DUF11 domain-containing protein [Chloroflexota bacterium]